MKTLRIIQFALIVSFIIAVYFLLPYVLPIFGIKPYVIITGSMSHSEIDQSLLESFYENLSVEPEDLPLRYGFHRGDLLIAVPSENYSLGDVVVMAKPGSSAFSVHRIFKLNSTHFRDIGDRYITEENFRTVTLVVNDRSVIATDKPPETLLVDVDLVYKGPYYESYSHYWTPLNYIEGKTFMVFPSAGQLYLLLEGSPPQE
ncbi:MAG: hypothetical protein JSV39_00425 [Candidatus Aenigmatarchaeota archaeon]|nr:MAG: hypothetical protein JSV39_00425 [Candidatus Aenigmarchaeota archaeon]